MTLVQPNKPPWKLWLSIIIGGVYVGGQLVVVALAYAFWLLIIPSNQKPTPDGFLAWPPIMWVALGSVVVSGMAALALTWAILRFRVERPLVALGFERGRSWLLALTPPMTFLVMIGVTLFVTTLLGLEELSVEAQEMLFETPSIGVVSAIVVSTLVPLIEEILFRGLIFEPIRYRLGNGWAVVVSGMLFAGAHLLMVTTGEAIVGLVAIWLSLGLFLGALRVYTGTLWGPILGHATWNVIASLGALLAQLTY